MVDLCVSIDEITLANYYLNTIKKHLCIMNFIEVYFNGVLKHSLALKADTISIGSIK